MSLNRVVQALREGRRFLLSTHKEPDGDGVGSMLALGRSLSLAGKEVTLLAEEPLPHPYDLLRGAEGVVCTLDPEAAFDGIILLDCAETTRLGGVRALIGDRRPLINIDHHETNDRFGDLNLVDLKSSSTGEMVYRLIERANLPLSLEVAENIFAAIQTDTGSFSYGNATARTFRIAARLLSLGVKPAEVSRKMTGNYPASRLSLLRMALGTLEFHHNGRIGMMTLPTRFYEEAHADRVDGERFVDYPRYIEGVEIAVLIRQTGKEEYKFSLRSNDRVDVGRLALRFGGGGHARAAGFEAQGSVGRLKRDFLEEAIELLDGKAG